MHQSQPGVHTACFHAAKSYESLEGIFFCLQLIMKHTGRSTLISSQNSTKPYLQPQQNNKHSVLRCLPRLVEQCCTVTPVTVKDPSRCFALQCEEDLHVVSVHERSKASAPYQVQIQKETECRNLPDSASCFPSFPMRYKPPITQSGLKSLKVGTYLSDPCCMLCCDFLRRSNFFNLECIR